jgi:hypothetical protein
VLFRSDIQLSYAFDEDFVSLTTYIANHQELTTQQAIAAYNDELATWSIDNPDSIRIELDSGLSGFSGGTNFETSQGVVRLKRVLWEGLLDTALYTLAGDYGPNYKQKDVLMHETMHALGVEHIMGVLDSPEERRISSAARATSPLMNPFVSSYRHGLSMNDLSALMKLYGRLPGYNRITVNFTGSNALNVALIPASRNVINYVKRNFNNVKGKKYKNKLVAKACAHAVIGDTVDLYVPDGPYLIEVRGAGNVSGTSGFEGESGDPSISEPFYLNKRYKAVNLIKADRIVIKNDMVIEVIQ